MTCILGGIFQCGNIGKHIVSVLPRVTCGILSQLSRDGAWQYWENYCGVTCTRGGIFQLWTYWERILIVVSVLPRVTCGILSLLFSRDGAWRYCENYYMFVILDDINFQFTDVSCET